ncbi:MAG: hypothetical protein QXT28_09645 [Thermofilaceae archaeon]
MGLGRFGRFLRAVAWYISFFNLWAVSLALTFAYLYTYDRFRIEAATLHGFGPLEEAASRFLIGTANTHLEAMIASMHLALLAAILFSFEEGEGLSYIRYSAGLGRLSSYAAKLAASTLLFTAPLLAAKAIVILSWDYRVLFNPFFAPSLLSLFSNLSLYALYLTPILALLAILVKRPAYYLILIFLELYIIEGRLELLGVRRLYSSAALWWPLGFITTARGSVFSPPHALIILFPQRFLASLACAALTLAWYRLKGEVRWR